MFLWHIWNLVNGVIKVKEMYVWMYAHVHVYVSDDNGIMGYDGYSTCEFIL